MPAYSQRPTTDERTILKQLQSLPNVGPATARDLWRLGIRAVDDLKERDPERLYTELCDLDGRRHDPYVRDVLTAVVDFANGAEARPWWAYTPARKARDLAAKGERA